MAAKKVPMRMCVGCRVMRPKKEMLRVVRSSEGQVRIDPTGKAAGRGAYICKDIACLERAIKTRGLERAFEQKVEPELYETLKSDFMKQYG